MLAALAVLPFLQGFFYPFVFDDNGVITENAFLSRPESAGNVLTLRTIPDPEVIDGQRPAVILTYLADRWAWGAWAPGFRITNYLLHAGCTVLLFCLLARLMPGNRGLIMAATLLFAWHPLVIEVVHSPAFREDSLSLSGGFIFLLAATRGRMGFVSILLALSGFALSLLAKESGAVMLALLVLAWWLMPAWRPSRANRAALSGGTLGMIGLYGYALAVRGSAQALGERWNGTSLVGAECFFTPPWLLLRAIGKMVFPHPLSIDYRIFPVPDGMDLRFWFGVLAFLLVLVAAWRYRRKNPVASFGMLWIIAGFLPVSNCWPLFNPVADRYAYLMLPGLALIVAALLPHARKVAHSGLWIALLILAFVTAERMKDWRDERALWTSALAVEPQSARAHTWLGLLEKAEGRPGAAMLYFEKAAKLNPHDPAPLVNMGAVMVEQGDLAGAEARFRAALALDPGQKQARENLRLLGLEP